ncbi:hypothetical protein EDB19DRAFT_1907949 [Suillus lakei]|nr:hypothetical protein EDB19DRAFT_1907949 [Suillus lakei]
MRLGKLFIVRDTSDILTFQILLGSDGAWTYGGLTSPAASTSSLTTASTSISASTSATSNPSSNDTALSSYSSSYFCFSFAVDEENRPTGLGSPRDSGDDEANSFLRRSTATDPERRPRPVSSLPPDYGVVVPGSGRLGLGQAYIGDGVPAHARSEIVGHIMPPGELLRIGDEEESEDLPPPRMHSASHPSLPEHIAPLLPLPPFEGTATRKPSHRSLLNEKEKSLPSASYSTSDLEDSKVFTTRPVRVQELGSGSPQDDDSTNTQPAAAPGSRRNSFSRLRQSCCLGLQSSCSGSNSCRGSNKDAEAAQSLLGRRLGVGYTTTGERPMSSVSAKSAVSGNTVCHDAVSLRGSAAPVMDFAPPMPSRAPLAYDDPYDLLGSRGPSPLSPTCIDILDIPALAPFSYASTSGRPLPPGLVPLSSRHAWRDSLSVITGSSNGAGITVDVLDAEPPRAGDSWRSLAGGFLRISTGPDPSKQRTTFVIPHVTHQENPMVFERGSAPAPSSRVFDLSRSNSSRPYAGSAHSHVATTSPASLNSGRPLGPISPSVSAFGHTDPSRCMFHTAEEYEDPFAEPGSRTLILVWVTQQVMSDDTEVTRAAGGNVVAIGGEDERVHVHTWNGNTLSEKRVLLESEGTITALEV